MYVVKAGIDAGNGYTKVKASCENEEVSFTIPSGMILNVGDEHLVKRKRQKDVYSCEVDVEQYFVGNIDDTDDNYISTNTGKSRYTSKHYLFLADFVQAVILKKLNIPHDADIEIKTVIGVPSAEADTKIVDVVKNVFEGTKTVKISSKNYTFTTTVYRVIAQATGTVIAEAVKDSKILDEHTLVLDFGTGTFDIDVVKDGKIIKSMRKTIPNAGSYFIYEVIEKALYRKYPELQFSWKKVEKYWDTGEYIISKHKTVDMSALQQKVLKKHIEENIMPEVNRQTQGNIHSYDNVILTGGMANDMYIKHYFKEAIPNIIIVADAQTANAEGLYQLAKRKAK